VADTPLCNLHVTFITSSERHYHRRTTEVYLVLEGTGTLELDEERVDVGPGSVIYIEPGVRHRLTSAAGVRTVVFGVPALLPDDEYFD
jgi:mannose-6-phosphate isomerase-like protein (cupin superfamily)